MEKYLPQCLDSLLIPSFDKIEVLVINDGSKDRTSEIAHDYASKYPNSIRVIDKENGNYGSCINRGIKEVSGKYVKILDADDSFDTDSLVQYIDFLEKSDADAIVNDYVVVSPENRDLKRHSFKMFVPYESAAVSTLIETFPFKEIAMHAIAFKTGIFKTLEYYQSEGIFYTDDEWIFSPVSKVETIAYCPLPLYRYLLGREGQTASEAALQRNILHIALSLSKMLDIYDKSADLSGFHDKYLKERINRKKNVLYYTCIVSNQKYINFDLSKFDNELKLNHPEMYKSIENDTLSAFKIFKVSYIKVWRENGSNAFQLQLLRVWKNIRKFLKLQ